MKVMFLDESGDHNLNPKKIAPNYPIFALGGVIIDRAYLRTVVEPDMNRFKVKYFGHSDVTLHTVDMRHSEGVYAFLKDPLIRTAFFDELNQMLLDWDYKVVACVVKKLEYIEFAKLLRRDPSDPYMFSLNILVDRFCFELTGTVDQGFICAEKRGGNLDRDLMAAWEHTRTNGAQYMTAYEIDHRIVGLDLRDKTPNLAGLQLADLVITPVGQHVSGRRPRDHQVQWSVVRSKFRHFNGEITGRGLVIRP